MTPTIVLDTDHRPMLVTGASGGPFIITTVFQAISNRLDYGLGVSALMQAPRMHHQHLPDALHLEQNGFDAAEVSVLQKRGHEVRFFERPDGGSIGATIERRDGSGTASRTRIQGRRRVTEVAADPPKSIY